MTCAICEDTGWKTIYLSGNGDFKEDVAERLEKSELNFMPGYTGASGETTIFNDLYWLDEGVSLREFKEAIGSKLIWKYRLRFFDSLESFLQEQSIKSRKSTEFTAEERALLKQMQESFYREAS